MGNGVQSLDRPWQQEEIPPGGKRSGENGQIGLIWQEDYGNSNDRVLQLWAETHLRTQELLNIK